MLHGYGDQKFLKKSYAEDRQKALDDRTRFTDDELTELEIGATDGTGRTRRDITEIYQFPFPTDTTIRPRRKINIKDVDPTIGEMSD